MAEPFLTTGQAADVLGTSDRYVAQLCDEGVLPCHKLPSSNRRRIRQADLSELMRQCNIPLSRLRQYLCGMMPNASILIGLCDGIRAETIAKAFNDSGSFVADSCMSALALGCKLAKQPYAYTIYDIDIVSPIDIYDIVVTMVDEPPVLIAYGDTTTATLEGVVRNGYAQAYLRPDDSDDMIFQRIKDLHNNACNNAERR